MNAAKYIGLDVHPATIAVVVLGAVVCAALADRKEQIA